MTILTFILAGTLAAATPLLLAALGELIAERAGVLNLGIEGMMALGAAVGFVVTYNTHNPVLGFAVAALAGMALSLVFATLALGFMRLRSSVRRASLASASLRLLRTSPEARNAALCVFDFSACDSEAAPIQLLTE